MCRATDGSGDWVPPSGCSQSEEYKVVSGRACAGRNELPTQTGITLEEAKAYCDLTASCSSFENMVKGCTTNCKVQFSTSCIESNSAVFPNHELFIKTGNVCNTFTCAVNEYKMVPVRSCIGRNELPTQQGITLKEAKAYCDRTASCTSFEVMGSGASNEGSTQFSTSCIESNSVASTLATLFIKTGAADEICRFEGRPNPTVCPLTGKHGHIWQVRRKEILFPSRFTKRLFLPLKISSHRSFPPSRCCLLFSFSLFLFLADRGLHRHR